jgi:hypothetical protein
LAEERKGNAPSCRRAIIELAAAARERL